MLARLGLGEIEEEFYAAQLSGILGHIDRMRDVDTESIPATAQVVEIEGGLRDDVPLACLAPEQALANAPEAREGCFVAKSIQEADPG